MDTKDSVGNILNDANSGGNTTNVNILNDGDSVTINKDLKIKGMSKTLKRGLKIKNIRLTNSNQEVECRVGKSVVVLKTQFLKKA